MGSILAYSGIATKIRAMQSRFLTKEDFHTLISCESVPKAVTFLKTRDGYRDLFAQCDESSLHRGDIEQLLSLSKYYDFSKLYRFANVKQRRFLDLYFIHYEIIVLKTCIRSLFAGKPITTNYAAFETFFEAHSDIDIVALSSCSTLNEFLENLTGTRYGPLLSRIASRPGVTLFDYEMQLDLSYFRLIWKSGIKCLDKAEQQILMNSLGTKMDLMNLLWICRAKEFYHMKPETIYALLIPIRYKLKDSQLAALVESADLTEFYSQVRRTFYSRFLPEDARRDTKDLEAMYHQTLGRIHARGAQKNPYSVAVINAYFYYKEMELHKIITAIESIRYGLNPKDIQSIVLGQS